MAYVEQALVPTFNEGKSVLFVDENGIGPEVRKLDAVWC